MEPPPDPGRFTLSDYSWLPPSPSLSAVEAIRARRADRLVARPDRFSQLIGCGITYQQVGGELVGQNIQTPSEHAEVQSLAADAARHFSAEIIERIEALRAALTTVDPLLASAQVAFNNVYRFSIAPFDPANEGSEVAAEIVASIVATQHSLGDVPPPSEVIQDVEDHLVALADAQLLCDLANAFDDSKGDPRLRIAGQANWRNLRGDSYVHHGRDLARSLLKPCEQLMRTEFGFGIDEFCATADAIIDLLGQRIGSHITTSREMVTKAMQDVESGLAGSEQRFLDAMATMFDGLPRCLVFTGTDVASVSGLESTTTDSILGAVSVHVGSMPAESYRSAFDESPLIERPLIRRGDKFVLPVPGHLVRSPHKLFEKRLLARSPKFSAQRAKVVDDLATELIAGCLVSWKVDAL